MTPIIFIDGEAGTTGLQIHSQLTERTDLRILSLSQVDRKDPIKRAEALNSCDIAILCLPDEAAKQAVSFIVNSKVRVLDASSAHRTTPGWVYGLPELTSEQSEKISHADRISNPGCYPTGAILLIRPLVDAGLIAPDYPINVHAVSGYSGSGRQLIDMYEDPNHPERTSTPYRAYGLALNHKHTPEMKEHSHLSHAPLFTPAYGNYRQGIILYVPLHTRLMKTGTSAQHVHAAFESRYAHSEYIKIWDLDQNRALSSLEPEILNGTNNLHIHVFESKEKGQILLGAVYDNLGKGASGAAIQNLNLMLKNLHN